jgi:ribose transport system substrate-binding protein
MQKVRLKAFTLPLLVASALGVVACGGGSSNGGGSASSGGTSTKGSGFADLQQRIDEAKAIPRFTFDGAPIDARAIAAGKWMQDIPFTTSLEYEADIASGMKQAADSIGLRFDVVKTNGPSTWAPAMDTAVSQGVDLIHLSSTDPTALRPQIKTALGKGSKVVSSHYWDSSQTSLGDAARLTAWTGIDYVTPAKLLADWVINDSGGKAKVLVIGEPEFTFNEPVIAGIKSEFQAHCPSCELDVIGVPLADWTSKIPTEVTKAVQADQVGYVIPFIDGMVSGVQDGLRQSAASDVKIATYGATPFVLDLVRKGDVALDCGYPVYWTGYAFLDQALRALGGKPTDPDHNVNIGLRCFDQSNASDAGTPARAGAGFGDAYIEGYRRLWGLG